MKAVAKVRSPNARGRRDDGANTKAQILDAAGEIFAEKGFDRATGKEIAERAGTNSAAVNYYYGGIEGLYEEVLVEAHHRLVSYEALTSIAGSPQDSKAKLRGFIELVVRTLTGPASSSWAFRVLSREILSPSPFVETLREREIQPKKLLLSGIVEDIMKLPPDHPAVAHGCLSILAPCAMLLVGDRRFFARVFPALGADAAHADRLADHMVRFALAGLEALSSQYRDRLSK